LRASNGTRLAFEKCCRAGRISVWQAHPGLWRGVGQTSMLVGCGADLGVVWCGGGVGVVRDRPACWSADTPTSLLLSRIGHTCVCGGEVRVCVGHTDVSWRIAEVDWGQTSMLVGRYPHVVVADHTPLHATLSVSRARINFTSRSRTSQTPVFRVYQTAVVYPTEAGPSSGSSHFRATTEQLQRITFA